STSFANAHAIASRSCTGAAFPAPTSTVTHRQRRTPSCTRSTFWSTGPRSTGCPRTRSTRGFTWLATTCGRPSRGCSRSRPCSPCSSSGGPEMQTKTNTPSPRGYANQVVTKPPTWHDLVVFDVLFNNLTTGLFLVAAVGELAAPAVFTPVATWAYPLALALLLIDLGLLVLDLGDKLRFHHMLRVFKPSSPI